MKSRKTRGASRNVSLREVIECLLSGEGSCMHTGPDRRGFVYLLTNGPQHFAIERLFAHFKPSTELADLAVNAYLDRFERGPKRLLRETDAITYALRIAERASVSAAVAERVVSCVAQAGWHGRLEWAAQELCGRDPTPQEVVWLIDTYVNDLAVQSSNAVKVYGDYARKYLPPGQAAVQIERIKQHDEDFLRD